MRFTSDFFWKRSPFLRLVCPFIAGIIFHFYVPANNVTYASIAALVIVSAILCSTLHLYSRFRLQWLNGVFINVFLFVFGAKILSHQQEHFRHSIIPPGKDSVFKFAVINEPLVEKANSYKTTAIIYYFKAERSFVPVQEKIIVYFQKNGNKHIDYGDVIVFKIPLQTIKHSGNPGAFNFKEYCLFQGIYHQVFLTTNTYHFLPFKVQNRFRLLLIKTRECILEVLRKNISGRKEYGLAEAILIGYKDDLDRDLVKSYSETGVMHVIAISGLHLGIIYLILNAVTSSVLRGKRFKLLQVSIVLTGLWLFSFLTGGSASVLRSALMFTCLLIGNSLGRKSPATNSLASAGFLLLFENPYLLWDVGFQLSFAAVLSILLFERRVYNLLFFKPKYLDVVWKMCSVTLAAQILTTPLSIFYFHQFPLLFLFTNIIAIPLSSLILFGEIFLCVVAFLPPVALLTGKLVTLMIQAMNAIIGFSGSIPYSSWTNLQISLLQLILLYILIAALTTRTSSLARRASLAFSISAGILLIRIFSFKEAIDQRAIQVYQVPRKMAIELIQGRSFIPVYDSSLVLDAATQDYHLKPAHILFRTQKTDRLSELRSFDRLYNFHGKRIMIVDRQMKMLNHNKKMKIDIIIYSGNPLISIDQLLNHFEVSLLIIDSSNSEFRARKWSNDCMMRGLPVHSVPEQGAIRINI